mgnify:CR=1 FL=1
MTCASLASVHRATPKIGEDPTAFARRLQNSQSGSLHCAAHCQDPTNLNIKTHYLTIFNLLTTPRGWLLRRPPQDPKDSLLPQLRSESYRGHCLARALLLYLGPIVLVGVRFEHVLVDVGVKLVGVQVFDGSGQLLLIESVASL